MSIYVQKKFIVSQLEPYWNLPLFIRQVTTTTTLPPKEQCKGIVKMNPNFFLFTALNGIFLFMPVILAQKLIFPEQEK